MSTEPATAETVTVAIDRVFDTTIERLWQMFTDPDEIVRWEGADWYDPIAIDVDLRVGGVIHRRVGSREDGTDWTFHGVYYEIEEPTRLVYSFDWKIDWRDPPAPSMVTIELSSAGPHKVEVHVEHGDVRREGAESARAHWKAFLDALAELLRSG